MPALGTRQDEQALGNADEVVHLGGRAYEGAAKILGAPLSGERRVDLRLQDRERRPQLVARVVDEAALALERLLETVEGEVQRHGQAAERVVGHRHRQSVGGIGRRDGCRLAAHALDGAERCAGQEPSDERRQDEGDGKRDREPHERRSRASWLSLSVAPTTT